MVCVLGACVRCVRAVCTWGDVEVVPDGQAPDSSSDTGRKAVPPQLPHTPRALPVQTGCPDIKYICSALHVYIYTSYIEYI